MSRSLFSDEQTTDKCDSPSVEQLLKENRMKDLALSKATNLIELLNIQIQVERNSHQESIKLLEEEFRQRYEKVIHDLESKLELLERELKQRVHVLNSNEKEGAAYAESAVRRNVLARVNSAKSLENKKKKSSVNKKYTQTFSNEDEARNDKNAKPISQELYKLNLLELYDWKNQMMEELNEIVKTEYDELEHLINQIESISEDYECIANHQPKGRQSIEPYLEIIKSQNLLINSLKTYSQELQDLCKAANFKLSSLISKNEQHRPLDTFNIQSITQQILDNLSHWKDHLRSDYSSLQGQNLQLKSILDNMIKLVRQQKKMR